MCQLQLLNPPSEFDGTMSTHTAENVQQPKCRVLCATTSLVITDSDKIGLFHKIAPHLIFKRAMMQLHHWKCLWYQPCTSPESEKFIFRWIASISLVWFPFYPRLFVCTYQQYFAKSIIFPRMQNNCITVKKTLWNKNENYMVNFHGFYATGTCSKFLTLNIYQNLGSMFSAAALGLYNGMSPETCVALTLMTLMEGLEDLVSLKSCVRLIVKCVFFIKWPNPIFFIYFVWCFCLAFYYTVSHPESFQSQAAAK